MTHGKGVITAIIRDKIAEFVGAEIGQVQFFNAEIDVVMNKGNHDILIKYHNEELRLFCNFTSLAGAVILAESISRHPQKTIPLADDKLYKTDNWNELCKTLDKHMQKCVGKTITAFLQKHNPKKGD